MTLKINGATGGSVSIDAPDNTSPSGTDVTLTLPTSAGSSGQYLQTNGSGTLSWQTVEGLPDAIDVNASAPADSVNIDASGRLLVGTSSSDSQRTSRVQIAGNGDLSGWGSSLNLSEFGTSYNPWIALQRSRNSTIGSHTVVNSGDILGGIQFNGSDGNSFESGASIKAEVDGTPGDGDMPGRLIFSTTADGASSPTEKARITRDGYFKASNIGDYTSASSISHEFGSSANVTTIFFRATNGSFASTIGTFRCARGAFSGYNFVVAQSNNGGDNEFVLRGDGQAYADQSWNGGGADYAEYFEWSDGNTTAEDRRGISVVLDGDKIREAVAGEEPIGVISGNPSVVGDAAWNKWNGKYLRDDFGSYIRNEEGERQLNPDYDPDVEYIPREQRPEWDCVGLMGKLRIRKGQVTGARWIKMRDVSDTVEEWLVR